MSFFLTSGFEPSTLYNIQYNICVDRVTNDLLMTSHPMFRIKDSTLPPYYGLDQWFGYIRPENRSNKDM